MAAEQSSSIEEEAEHHCELPLLTACFLLFDPQPGGRVPQCNCGTGTHHELKPNVAG